MLICIELEKRCVIIFPFFLFSPIFGIYYHFSLFSFALVLIFQNFYLTLLHKGSIGYIQRLQNSKKRKKSWTSMLSRWNQWYSRKVVPDWSANQRSSTRPAKAGPMFSHPQTETHMLAPSRAPLCGDAAKHVYGLKTGPLVLQIFFYHFYFHLFFCNV